MAKGNSNPQLGAALASLTPQGAPPQGLLNAAPPDLAPQIASLLTPDAPQPATPSLLAANPAPVNGYNDLPAGPLPAPQTIEPPVYTDQAIGSDATPVPMSKTVGGVTTAPQVAPHPIAPPPQSAAPDSATPLAQTTEINQQALAAALARLQAAQSAGYQPSSLFRRASPAGAYQ